jgi:hypothetical protein
MQKNTKTLTVALSLIAFLMSGVGSTSCFAADLEHTASHSSEHSRGHNQEHGVQSYLVIKAPVETVFEGIKMSRHTTPEKRHMVSHEKDSAVIDEKISDLPVIGTAHLVYKEIEVSSKRIDYLLISSDKLKTFEGSWELTPLDNGETKVSLKSFTEVKVWVPFAKELSCTSTLKDINRRLGNLKQWCDDQSHRQAKAHTCDETVLATTAKVTQ